MDRYTAEQLIQSLTGGAEPSDGDTIIFTVDGWIFYRVRGTLSLEDGTETEPSLSFASQPDLGIYKLLADILAFTKRVALEDGTPADPILCFVDEVTLGLYRKAAGQAGLSGSIYVEGDIEQAAGQNFGVLGATPAAQQAKPTLGADGSSDAGPNVGIDNAQVGNVYAQVSDLDALTTEFNALRATVSDLRTKYDQLRDRVGVTFGFLAP